MNSILQVFKNKKMFFITVLGFSSGLPLALTGGTLQAWLTDSKIDITTVGIFSLVGFPYTIKFLWSPFLDNINLRIIGRRRGWAFIILTALIASEVFMAFLDPKASLGLLAFGAFLISFFSASQDIVVDALRTEILEKNEFGAGAGMYNMGYRVAMLISGAVALSMADHLPWREIYLSMALVQCLGLVAVYYSPEPTIAPRPILRFRQRVVEPFLDFFGRQGAWEILVFIMIYKLGTMMGSALSTRFLMDLQFSKTEIGAVSKVVGLVATILGTLTGGALMTRLGMLKSLWIFGALQALGMLSFILLAVIGQNYLAMALVIGTENFMIGLGVAAIQGFIMSVCSLQFTGTQFALMSSMAAITRVIFTSQSGRIVENFGWINYFIFSAALGIPGLLLLTQYKKWSTGDKTLLRPVKSLDLWLVGSFMSGLLVMCTEVFWRLSGHEVWGTYASSAGATIASSSLLLGIVVSRYSAKTA